MGFIADPGAAGTDQYTYIVCERTAYRIEVVFE